MNNLKEKSAMVQKVIVQWTKNIGLKNLQTWPENESFLRGNWEYRLSKIVHRNKLLLSKVQHYGKSVVTLTSI